MTFAEHPTPIVTMSLLGLLWLTLSIVIYRSEIIGSCICCPVKTKSAPETDIEAPSPALTVDDVLEVDQSSCAYFFYRDRFDFHLSVEGTMDFLRDRVFDAVRANLVSLVFFLFACVRNYMNIYT